MLFHKIINVLLIAVVTACQFQYMIFNLQVTFFLFIFRGCMILNKKELFFFWFAVSSLLIWLRNLSFRVSLAFAKSDSWDFQNYAYEPQEHGWGVSLPSTSAEIRRLSKPWNCLCSESLEWKKNRIDLIVRESFVTIPRKKPHAVKSFIIVSVLWQEKPKSGVIILAGLF